MESKRDEEKVKLIPFDTYTRMYSFFVVHIYIFHTEHTFHGVGGAN